MAYYNSVIARSFASLLLGTWIACGSRCLATAPAAANSPPLSATLNELFAQLDADSYKAREEATQRLANYGELIRPALLDAAHHSDSPEQRLRAQRLLSALSWSQPTDPPEVQQILDAYRAVQPEVRNAVVQSLGKLGNRSFDALLRLLVEEPCDDIRWVIVEQLHHFTDDAQRERLRRLDTKADDAPMAAAAGWGWLPSDPNKGLNLLRRSADLATPHALEDPTELLLVLKTLYTRSLNVGNYESAIERMRQMILHNERPLSEMTLELLALHAEYGPQRGFEQDVHLAQSSFYSPEMMYVLGRLQERQNKPLLAAAMYQAAGLTAMGSQETHFRVASFLMEHHWYDLAKIEWHWVLATTGSQKDVLDVTAHDWLAKCAMALGDDAEAEASAQTALTLIGRIPGINVVYIQQLRSEIDWYALRVAKAKGDLTAMASIVDRATAVKPVDSILPLNPEFQIDLVNSLKTLHRDEAATLLFNPLFDAYNQQLEVDPNDPEVLNNLAWLCARCNEHRDDAIAWSAKAVQLAPANAAYLDTAAEAVARMGHWDQAVNFEKAALKLQPGDRFMISQLLRFQDNASNAK